MISLRLILSSGMVDRGIVDCWRSALKPQSPQGSLRLQTSVVVVSPTPGISHFVQFQFWSWNTDEKQWLFTHYCKLQQQSVSLVKYLKRGCPTNHSLPTLLLLCYASLLLCSAAQYELLCWEDCCSYSWQNSDRPVPAIACHYYEYHCILALLFLKWFVVAINELEINCTVVEIPIKCRTLKYFFSGVKILMKCSCPLFFHFLGQFLCRRKMHISQVLQLFFCQLSFWKNKLCAL